MAIAKATIGSKGICLNVCAGKQSETSVQLVFQTRRWQDRIHHPLRSNFPADTAPGEDRITALQIDSETEDKLQLGAIDVGPADDEWNIESIAVQVLEAGAIKPRLRF